MWLLALPLPCQPGRQLPTALSRNGKPFPPGILSHKLPGRLCSGMEVPGRTKRAHHTLERGQLEAETQPGAWPAGSRSRRCPSPDPSAPRGGITVHPTARSGCPSPCRPGSGHSSLHTSSRSAGNSPHQRWPPADRSAPGKCRTVLRWERTWGCRCLAPKTPAGNEKRTEALAPSAGSSARAVPGRTAEPDSSTCTLQCTLPSSARPFTLALGRQQRAGAPISAPGVEGEVSPHFPYLPQGPFGSEPACHTRGWASPKEWATPGGGRKWLCGAANPRKTSANSSSFGCHSLSHRR